MRQPDVTADHAVITDNSLTAENRRPGINHHTVTDVRMALDALDKRPVFPDFETLCAERDMLVQLHVIADRRRLSDDDTGSVVNKEESLLYIQLLRNGLSELINSEIKRWKPLKMLNGFLQAVKAE